MIMMYAFAAWLGGVLTAATLWETAGPLLAIVLAPFGGSALALAAALGIFLRHPGRDERERPVAEARHWWHPVR